MNKKFTLISLLSLILIFCFMNQFVQASKGGSNIVIGGGGGGGGGGMVISGGGRKRGSNIVITGGSGGGGGSSKCCTCKKIMPVIMPVPVMSSWGEMSWGGGGW